MSPMRMPCLALALPLLLAPAASAQRADTPEAGEKAAAKMSEMSAEEFVAKTAAANQFEIDASKLAVGQAKKKEVKELAEALVSDRSEEHTSELQSPCNLVCRLLLEKKKDTQHPGK